MTKNKKRKKEQKMDDTSNLHHSNKMQNNNAQGSLLPLLLVTAPMIPDGWDRCHAYNAQKKRFCRQQPIPTPQSTTTTTTTIAIATTQSLSSLERPLYCGNHQHLRQQQQQQEEEEHQDDYYCRPAVEAATAAASMEEDVEEDPPSSSTNYNNNKNNNTNQRKKNRRNRKRIPCPIDPSHFIFEDMVQKHVLICPRLKRTRLQQEQVYYQRNCNCGGHGSSNTTVGSNIGMVQKEEENNNNNNNNNKKDTTDQSIHRNYNHNNNNDDHDLAWAQRVAVRVLKVYAQLFWKENNDDTTTATATTSTTTTQAKNGSDLDDEKKTLLSGDITTATTSATTTATTTFMTTTITTAATTTATTALTPPPPRTLTGLQIHQALPLEDYSNQELNAGLLQGIESYRIKSGGARHVPQLASLIGHLRAIDVLPPLYSSGMENIEKEHGLSTTTTSQPSATTTTPAATTTTTKMKMDATSSASTTTNSSPSSDSPIIEDQPKFKNHGGVLVGSPIRNRNGQRRRLVLLEMGAGRGIFGLVAAGVAAAAAAATTTTRTTATSNDLLCGKSHRKVHLAMVERAGSRGKADTVLRTLPVALRPTQKPAMSRTTTAVTTNGNKATDNTTTSRPLEVAEVGLETADNIDNDNDNRAVGTTNAVVTTNNNNNTNNNNFNNNNSHQRPYLQLEPIEWSRLTCDLAHVHLPTVLGQIKVATQKKEKASTRTNMTNTESTACSESRTTEEIPPASNASVGDEKEKEDADNNNNNNDDDDDDDQEDMADEVVVIAKHLCGVGTDFALKSMEPIRNQVSAVIMATCCHGICNWNDYVGRDYLTQIMTTMTETTATATATTRRNGEIKHPRNHEDIKTTANNENKECAFYFGPQEFELLRRWSAGTVASPSLGVEAPAKASKAPVVASEAENSGYQRIRTRVVDHDHQQKQVEEADLRLPKETMGGDDEKGVEDINDNKDDDDDGHGGHTKEAVASGVVDTGIGVATVVQSLSLPCGVQGLGRACQRLIDYGRCEYLNQVIFSNEGCPPPKDHNKIDDDNNKYNRNSKPDHNTTPARLCVYVPPDVTPQNAILIARRRSRK
jgi:hypothetical protein